MLELQNRQLKRESQRLEKDLTADFQRIGDRSGRTMGLAQAEAYSRSLSPRLARITKQAAEAADVVALKEGNLSAARQKLEAIGNRLNAMETDLASKRQAAVRDLDAEAKVTDKANRLRIQRANVTRQLTRAEVDFNRAQRTHSEKAGSLASLTNIDTSGAVASVGRLTTAVGGLGRVAGPIGLAVLAGGALQLGAAAATASQALWLLPAAAGAAGAGVGTLALATHGFGDAISNMGDPKKFAEALAGLSPNAQQAALSIKTLVDGPLGQLQKATQDALFAGVGPQLEQLTGTLGPVVEQMTTGIASSFNQMFQGISRQLMTPETTAAIQAFAQNITAAFQNLAPAVQPLTQAFGDLIAVGSDFLPDIASGAAQAAQAFADFVREASQSGQLREWIQEGLTVLKQMMQVLGDLTPLFGALADSGVGAMQNIVDVTHAVSTAFKLATGDATALRDVIPSIGDVAVSTFNKINSAIDTLILGPLRTVVEALNHLPGVDIPEIPHLPQFSNGMNNDRYQGNGGSYGSPTFGPPNAAVPSPLLQGVTSYANPGGWGPPAYTPSSGGGGGTSDSDRRDQIRDSLNPSDFTGAPPTAYAPPGYDDSAIRADQSVQRELYDLQQARMDLAVLEKDSLATEREITDAKQKVLEAGWAYQNAQRDLVKAQQQTGDQLTKGTQQLGAALDDDLGFSKGLPGLAENLVKFLANLALASTLGKLSEEAKDSAGPGTGILGLLAKPKTDATQGSTGQYAAPGYPQQGAYPGDAALLANVPAGRYSQSGNADLTQGLGDCSSAVEDLVNLMDGRPTGSRSMSTGNASEWLQSRGFQQGMGGPGDMRVGYNSGHMQATLPGGTPFNWGSDAAAARGGRGGTGADDQSFTDHYFRPAGSSPSAWSPSAGSSSSSSPSSNNWFGPEGAPSLTGPALTDPGLTAPMPYASAGESLPGMPPLGPMLSPGANPIGPLAAGLNYTKPRGIPLGQGMPASGGMGIGGGLIGAAQSAATSAASMGMSAAAGGGGGGAAASMGAQIAMDEINRAIGAGAQMAGIGVQGLMETFLPVESELADPMRGWFGRILGGVAGIRPQADITAGLLGNGQGQPGQEGEQAQLSQEGQPPLTPEQVAAQKAKDAQAGGPQKAGDTNIAITNNGATPDENGRAIARHAATANTAPGPGR